MIDHERKRIGPWLFTRFRLVLVIAALAVLLLNGFLVIRNAAVGMPWSQIWPAAVGVAAMLAVLIQSLRQARHAADEEPASSS